MLVKHWRDWVIQDQMTGAIRVHYTPPLRRVARFLGAPFQWLARHWLAHWKFWLNFLVGWTVALVAVVQWLESRAC